MVLPCAALGTRAHRESCGHAGCLWREYCKRGGQGVVQQMRNKQGCFIQQPAASRGTAGFSIPMGRGGCEWTVQLQAGTGSEL